MKLLNQVRDACRQQHFSRTTERVYAKWVEEFVRFHKAQSGVWRHPLELGDLGVRSPLDAVLAGSAGV